MSDGTRQAGDKGDLASLLAGFPVVVVQAVIWGDMDSYRHVNNVVYFRYFENARLEYFRRMDWFEYERQTGIGPILRSTQARFRKALSYPDTISIGARISAIEEDRMTMDYQIVSHRLDNSAGLDTPCAFLDDNKDHPLGRSLRVLNDEFHSSYRVRDRQIIVVNRQMKDSRFTISVLENLSIPFITHHSPLRD